MSAEERVAPSLEASAAAAADWVAAPDCVDVWLVDLGGVAGRHADALTPAERTRADRQASLRSRRAPRTFGPARAALRAILAGYFGTAPSAVEIAVGEHDRPVPGAGAPAGLDFNLSHAGDRALVAVSTGQRVGIDLEVVDASRDVRALAGRFFTPAERDRVLAARSTVREFYRLWTCKEAYLKAIGTGLSRSPRSFDVRLGDASSEGRARVEDAARPGPVVLCELEVTGDRVASLCVLGADARLRIFDASGLLG